VRAAVQTTPKLQRHVGKIPGWIVRAAARTDYDID